MLLKALVVLLLVSLASAAYISSIEVDVTSGQIYVVDETYFYEVDNVDLKQNMAHFLPAVNAGSYVSDGSLFVTKIGGKRRLYATFSYGTAESDDGADVGYFKVPIGNQRTLPLVSRVQAGYAPAHDIVYDRNRNVVIMGNSRNLTLVNLATMQVLDQAQSIFRVRTSGYNFVINHNTNSIIKFHTYYSVNNRGMFGLSVDEYDISTNKILYKDTTYDCACTTNPTASPFYQTELLEEVCKIDYAKNRIWCANNYNANVEGNTRKRFFSFQADNLAVYTLVDVTVDYDHIVWDFTARRAYAIDVDETPGFRVHKLNLDTGALIATYTNTGATISEHLAKLDPAEPNLYIPVYSTDASVSIIAVKTGPMTGKVIPLTSQGYYL